MNEEVYERFVFIWDIMCYPEEKQEKERELYKQKVYAHTFHAVNEFIKSHDNLLASSDFNQRCLINDATLNFLLMAIEIIAHRTSKDAQAPIISILEEITKGLPKKGNT